MHVDTFPVSHDVLEQKWTPRDYELSSIKKGTCQYCLSESVKVITQIGVKRFEASSVGYCLRCINVILPLTNTLEAYLGFKDSDDQHVIRIDAEKLENFLKKRKTQKKLSEEEVADLLETVKKNQENPDLAQAREYKKKPHQCDRCFGYILDAVNFEDFVACRSSENYLVSCFGCSALIARSRGCSVLTCPDTLCALQVCAFCLSGGSKLKDLQHDLSVCSQNIREKKAPPEPRQCDCENELN